MTIPSKYSSNDLADRITTLMGCEATALQDRLCNPNAWPVDVVSRIQMSVEPVHPDATLSAHLAGPPAGSVGTIRGFADGFGAAARFNYPYGVAVDGAGNVYVADLGNNRIRKITATGEVTTLAGSELDGAFADGTGAAARFNHPLGVAVDGAGNVYVGDTGNGRVRKIR